MFPIEKLWPLADENAAAFTRAREAGLRRPRRTSRRESPSVWLRYVVAVNGPQMHAVRGGGYVVVANRGGFEARRRFPKVRGKSARRRDKAARRAPALVLGGA